MDRTLSLNERWHLLGTFIEGYTYDQDAATLSQKCTEVCLSLYPLVMGRATECLEIPRWIPPGSIKMGNAGCRSES